VRRERLLRGLRSLRARVLLLYAVLALLNLASWGWALAVFRGGALPLALCVTVYGLGLRHAVDADHIAAIDNVTRKLLQQGQRPAAVGFFFAIGHSTLVMVTTAVVAVAAGALEGMRHFERTAATFGTLISASFLFAIAAVNVLIFLTTYRTYRRLRAGTRSAPQDLESLVGGGALARLLAPLLGLVTRSWHMFALGLLFGLGFDTATEVAVFGVSIGELSKGASLAAILTFPALFAAGMSLVDTTDGVMMLGAYRWALVNPLRKLHYNMAITLLSVAMAVLIGLLELVGLAAERVRWQGLPWKALAALSQYVNSLGLILIALALGAWLCSYLWVRWAGGLRGSGAAG